MANISTIKVGSTSYNIYDNSVPRLVITKSAPDGESGNDAITVYSLEGVGPIIQTGMRTFVWKSNESHETTFNLASDFNNNRYITTLIVSDHTRDSCVDYIEKVFYHVYGQTTTSFKTHSWNSHSGSVGACVTWTCIATKYNSASAVGGSFSGSEWYDDEN